MPMKDPLGQILWKKIIFHSRRLELLKVTDLVPVYSVLAWNPEVKISEGKSDKIFGCTILWILLLKVH